MSRLGRVCLWLLVVGLGVTSAGGLLAHAEDAVAPPPSVVPVPTSAPSTSPASTAPSSTTPGGATPTTVSVPERLGSGDVTVAKGEEESWTVRRIGTTVGLAVIGLAASGFVYGRIRSAARRSSSALVASSD